MIIDDLEEVKAEIIAMSFIMFPVDSIGIHPDMAGGFFSLMNQIAQDVEKIIEKERGVRNEA
jgi:hypothetical protein